MSRRNKLRAGIFALLGLFGVAASASSQAGWLDGDGPPVGCRLILDDFWPAWLCFITAARRAPAPAVDQSRSAKADVLVPGMTVTTRPGV
jgi:hypothetical protein